MPDRFPSPFEIVTPTGAEGWEELYGYSTVFSEDRRELEDSMFWFMDGVHTPEVIEPWDATVLDYAITFLGQYTTRHYVIPPALGVDIRYLNGYMYLSPVGVADPAEIEARVPEFAERAGYYFANWDTLYDAWMDKIKGVIAELEAIDFQPLPHREDMAVITEGRGIGCGQLMLHEYDRLVQLTVRSCGRTTSSSSTSATRRTSTSSASASSCGPRSPTRRSPRWWPASTSTCSGPTRS